MDTILYIFLKISFFNMLLFIQCNNNDINLQSLVSKGLLDQMYRILFLTTSNKLVRHDDSIVPTDASIFNDV